jgi:transcriptional regulator with XRE-family HTH domain
MNLIKKLENYRLDNKLTQEELAKKLGVSFCTVNRWINGKTNPRRIHEYHINKMLFNSKSPK